MKRLFVLTVCLFLFSSQLNAAGVVELSSATPVGEAVMRYVYTFRTNTSGAVSGDTTTIGVTSGYLIKAAIVPDSGGSQPTDQFDATLLDSRGADLLQASGANLSNVTGAVFTELGIWMDRGEHLQLTIANGGNTKSGTLILWIGGH